VQEVFVGAPAARDLMLQANARSSRWRVALLAGT